jgi:hypothetical protein
MDYYSSETAKTWQTLRVQKHREFERGNHWHVDDRCRDRIQVIRVASAYRMDRPTRI